MSKQSAYFRVPDIGGHDARTIKEALGRIRGVLSVSVNGTNKVAVDYDSTGTSCDDIRGEFERLGYSAQLLKNEDHTM